MLTGITFLYSPMPLSSSDIRQNETSKMFYAFLTFNYYSVLNNTERPAIEIRKLLFLHRMFKPQIVFKSFYFGTFKMKLVCMEGYSNRICTR